MLTGKSICGAIIATAAMFAAISPAYAADDSAALKDRLHAAQKDTTLASDDAAPFYLKLSVQLFDAKGKPSEQGTVEVYWADADRQKRVYTFPSYSATEIHIGDKMFRTPGMNFPPAMANLLIEQVLHPMAQISQIDNSEPKLQKLTLGKVPMECIVLAEPLNGVAPTYCFDPGSTLLRVSSKYGGLIAVRNMISTFQQRHVAMDVVVSTRGVETVEGKIQKLESRAVADSDLATNGLSQAPALVKASGGVVAGLALSKQDPIYPAMAKARHIQGTVVLHAVIGKDGNIRDLEVIYSPDPSLTTAAMDAVRQWKYKPYLLLGDPVDVETTINVNFQFAR